MRATHIRAAACGAFLLCGAIAHAADEPIRAKDIVLTRLSTAPMPGAQIQSYGMSVSVLALGADGLLRPRATDAPFQTGEKFRLRVLPTQDGTVLIANTNPQGVTQELLRVPVRAGMETLIPADPDNLFQLAGSGGEDVLHLQLYPNNLAVQSFNDARLASKDIRLVTQSTGSASYVVGQPSQPLYTRVVVRHQR